MSGINGIMSSIFGSHQNAGNVNRSAGPASNAVNPFDHTKADTVTLTAASQAGLNANSAEKSVFDRLVDGDLNPASELHPEVLDKLSNLSFMA